MKMKPPQHTEFFIIIIIIIIIIIYRIKQTAYVEAISPTCVCQVLGEFFVVKFYRNVPKFIEEKENYFCVC